MPFKSGDILDLDIDTLAYGGQGVARRDGFVVFVRHTVPGDRVRVQIVKNKRTYAEARVVDLLSPSPLRVPPPCGHSETCGGCEWQAIDYAAQLELKQQQVVESLQHIGGLRDYTLEPIKGMTIPWRYRNKMEFSFGTNEAGDLLLGLHKRGSWREVSETTDIWLAPEEMNRARQAVATACRALNLPPYSQVTHQGLLRHLVVRKGFASGDLFLNLFVTSRFREEEALAARVAEVQPYSSFAITVNESRADAAVGVGPFMVVGPPWFNEEILGVKLRVPALGFLQTNGIMVEALYDVALRWAAPAAQRSAYDLYCGIGALSLLLAHRAGHVYGMEIVTDAVAAAQENARLNGITNASFLAGDVRKLLRETTTAGGEPPAVVVTDPPRAGMAKKAVERTAALGAERIVYISCNPTTLAANAAQLTTLGYRLTRVAPVDMFPQTHHIEAVALFERQ